MEFNIVENNYDEKFKGLTEVAPDTIEAQLYQIIDDIDTSLDMFKPEMKNFEKYVSKKIKEAHRLIVSDGYKLYYAPNQVGRG
jgi:hypothetical protein